MQIEPITLTGRRVRLEPLSEAHHAQLCEVALDPDLWTVNSFSLTTPEQMLEYIRGRQLAMADATEVPFATIDVESAKTVGSTRFMSFSVKDRRVEIGGTFIAKPWQRSFVNTEAKYLMLCHAFEVWNCNRVEWKTDFLNEKSRAAILRLGAKQEGIMRSHMITWNGRRRDSVYFSVIKEEWPAVKAGLDQKLAR